MTQIAGNAKMSVCMDLEHTANVKCQLVLDESKTFYTVELTGGHLAGTISKLAEEGLVKIESFVEFGGGCIEYKVADLFTEHKVKDLVINRKFTHTEFPPHWNVEKIAEETTRLVEQAMGDGLLTENIHQPVKAKTTEGFELKIITESVPKNHDCVSIENTINKHVVTSYPYKG